MKMQSTPQTSKINGPVPLSFCILLYPDGKIERLVDQPFDDYLAAIPGVSLAWIDCSTKDDDKEIETDRPGSRFQQDPHPETDHRFLLGI